MRTGLEEFSIFIRDKGLRLTTQRTIVAGLALDRHSHFSAEDLLEWSRRKDPGISRATVYRTLALMVDGGLLNGLDFGNGKLHYEHTPGHRHHDHLICLGCGSVTEFHCSEIEELQCSVARRLDYSVAHHSLKIYGFCKKCRRNGRDNSLG